MLIGQRKRKRFFYYKSLILQFVGSGRNSTSWHKTWRQSGVFFVLYEQDNTQVKYLFKIVDALCNTKLSPLQIQESV